MSSTLPDLEAVTRAVRHLPPLPAVAAEILATLGEGGADPDTVANLLMRDTALAARTLRVANSPYFGLQGRIGSVQEAVVVLGLASIRSLVVASALTQIFAGRVGAGFDQQCFWRHALATAAAAAALGGALGGNPGILFLAGIMHDMGRLALLVTYPDAFEAVLARRAAAGGGWIEAERAVLGFDHADIGGALCEHWRFPAVIGAAVAGHHAPPDDAAVREADIVHAANAIAHALDLAGEAAAAVPALSATAWERLGLSWDQLQRVLAASEAHFDALVAMLG